MVTLQQFVSEYVEANNTTKESLAKQVGIGRTSFFSKIRGASDFTLREAVKLAAVLGCTLEELHDMQHASAQ